MSFFNPFFPALSFQLDLPLPMSRTDRRILPMEELHVREQFSQVYRFGAGHRCFTSTRRWSATDGLYTMRLGVQLNYRLLSRLLIAPSVIPSGRISPGER